MACLGYHGGRYQEDARAFTSPHLEPTYRATGIRKSRIQGTPPQRLGSTEMRVNTMALIDSGNDCASCPDVSAKLNARTECAFLV